MNTYTNARKDPLPGKMYACPCCHMLTLTSRGWHEICPVCGWDDDGQDDHDADEVRGAPNKVSLSQARMNYAEFGASEARRIERVRAPRPDEMPGLNVANTASFIRLKLFNISS
jgi:Cysteine-rich CPCC